MSRSMAPRSLVALALLWAASAEAQTIPFAPPPGAPSSVGTGGASASVCGTLLSAGNLNVATTGTAEETLFTYQLPANTLLNDGDRLRITTWAIVAANANLKSLIVRAGGAAGSIIGQAGPNAANNQPAMLFIDWVRSGVNAQDAGSINVIATTAAVRQLGTTVNLSTATDIVVRGTTPTAAGDLTLKGVVIECGKRP